jgi:hypothetical protein
MPFRWLLLGIGANMLLTAQWHDWGGGYCFGPRLLADLTPVLVFLIVPVVPRLKSLGLRFVFFLSASYSMLIHFLGAYISWKWEVGSYWNPYHHPLVFMLTGGDLNGFSSRFILTFVTVLLILSATYLGWRWAKRFELRMRDISARDNRGGFRRC